MGPRRHSRYPSTRLPAQGPRGRLIAYLLWLIAFGSGVLPGRLSTTSLRTRRVPDELKKHYLSDGEGGQYSTNLDRNRYGNDDNYLFTGVPELVAPLILLPLFPY